MKEDERFEEMKEYFESALGRLPKHHELLKKYAPEIYEHFYFLRKSSMEAPPKGVLEPKIKELIIIAVETALMFEGAITHAAAAVRAGATPAEVHEAVSLVLWLRGMPTYAAIGHKAVLAAEEEASKKSG